MAADYQTGTATSPTDLLQTLASWLVGQGWGLDASTADASGWRAHLHKGGLYVNFRAAANESIWNYNNAAGYGIGFYLGDGYSGAANWRSQSGAPLANGTANAVGVGMQLPSGSITAWHFFDDGADNIVVVVEKTPGIFVYLGWGPTLSKVGYATDFPYFFGSSSSFHTTSVPAGVAGGNVSAFAPTAPVFTGATLYSTMFFKVDAGTFSARWVSVTIAGGGNNAGYTGREGYCAADQAGQFTAGRIPTWRNLDDRSIQSAFVGALLLPLHVFVNTQPANRYAPVGFPAAVFYCQAVGNGWGASEIYTVGGVDYMVFPNFAVKKLV